ATLPPSAEPAVFSSPWTVRSTDDLGFQKRIVTTLPRLSSASTVPCMLGPSFTDAAGAPVLAALVREPAVVPGCEAVPEAGAPVAGEVPDCADSPSTCLACC